MQRIASIVLAWIGLLFINVRSVCAQAASDACNNLTRATLLSGGTAQTTAQCGQWSLNVTIAGQSVVVASPPQCVSSMVQRTGDIFTCLGAAPGIHCKANGDTIEVRTSVNATPCPTIPSTLPSTLAQVSAATACAALAVTIESNNSASISSCTTGQRLPGREDGEQVDVDGDHFFVRFGDPSLYLASAVANPTLTTLRSLESAPLSSLPSSLQAVVENHPAIAGAGDLIAQVSIVYPDLGGSPNSNNRAARVQGRVSSAGRFELNKTYRTTDGDGQPGVAVSLIAFDGATFFTLLQGSLNGNAWGSSSADQGLMLNVESPIFRELVDWCSNPFWVSLMPGIQRVAVQAPATGIYTITETYPGMMQGTPAGSTIYTLSPGAIPHPTRIDTVDATGGLVLRRDFSNYRQFATNAWRPTTIMERRFEPGSSEPSVVMTTTIIQASVLYEGSVGDFIRPQMQDECWFVRN